MTKRAMLILGFLLVLGACAAPVGVETTATDASSAATVAPVAPGVTEGAPTTAGEVSLDTVASMTPVPDGPAAPDFTLALGDGRSFTLSAEARPVYMVFWAEW